MKQYILDFLKGKTPIRQGIDFFEGHLRHWLYYSKSKFLIRKHIIEQIQYRIRVMNPECYQSGACVKCGCETLALQMASKACEGYCYPPFVSKTVWDNKEAIRSNNGVWLFGSIEKGIICFAKQCKNNSESRYIFYKQTPTGYAKMA